MQPALPNNQPPRLACCTKRGLPPPAATRHHHCCRPPRAACVPPAPIAHTGWSSCPHCPVPAPGFALRCHQTGSTAWTPRCPAARPAAGRHVSDLGVLVRKGGRTRLQAAHHWARETIDGCVAAGVRSVPLVPVWEGNGVPVSATNAAQGTSRCPAGPCCPMLRFLLSLLDR